MPAQRVYRSAETSLGCLVAWPKTASGALCAALWRKFGRVPRTRNRPPRWSRAAGVVVVLDTFMVPAGNDSALRPAPSVWSGVKPAP